MRNNMMTPAQWADTVGAEVWARFNKGEAPQEEGELKRLYTDVIQKAVLEERERCAALAESLGCQCKDDDLHDGCCGTCGRRIATAIRASIER